MKTVPLRRVSYVLNGGTPTSADENWGGGIPWVTPVDMARVNGGRIKSTDRSLTVAGLTAGSTLAPEGAVLLSTRAPIGYTALLPKPTAFNQGCKAVVPRSGLLDSRFLQYSLISAVKDLKAAGSGSTFLELSSEALARQEIPSVEVEEQRRIADFLDDQVDRIDRIVSARRGQIERAIEAISRLSYDCVRGATEDGERRDSGLPWLGPIPQGWPVLPVSSQYTVELGKMLDDKRQTGANRLPYLRNTNVQWDEVSTDDLKEMDIEQREYKRYTVEPGDLLICEGGQPGRSAIWRGDLRPLGYQKALHRARTRGRSHPEWLLECLRAAVDLNVFAAASGQTTIAHLTNEQLRGQRFPFPNPEIQARLIEVLRKDRAWRRQVVQGFERSIELLTDYKSSLITSAVMGKLDVTTAGSNIPG